MTTQVVISSEPNVAAQELINALGLIALVGGAIHIQPLVGTQAVLTLPLKNGEDLALLIKSLAVVVNLLTEQGFI